MKLRISVIYKRNTYCLECFFPPEDNVHVNIGDVILNVLV